MSDHMQQAWETAMGMRGYAGSPAEREDRSSRSAISEDGVKIGWRALPLDHPLIEKALALPESGAIMLHKKDRLFRGHHYKPHRDSKGWYIRQGKRGTIKSYLKDCEVTYLDGEPTLFQFRIAKGGAS